MLQIKEEMSSVLGNIKLPSQIHDIIEEIYEDYQKSYKKLIEYLKIKYPNKEKEILIIEEETLEDYKEDLQTIQTIEFEEYEQRRAVVIETINNVLKYMNENKNISKEKHTNNMSEVVEEKQDQSFTKIIIYNAINEIESSSKYLINRIKNLDLKEDKELKILEYEFIENLETIKQKAIQRAPEVKKIIREHFKSIYQKLINIIEIYEMQKTEENINGIIEKNNDTER